MNNRVGNPMDIIDSFTIGQTNFGANINYARVNKWVRLSSGTFSNFLITFCDQNLNLIQALDNNILITIYKLIIFLIIFLIYFSYFFKEKKIIII